jgi:cell fate regulator YaaT (PSP1 superfamily)
MEKQQAFHARVLADTNLYKVNLSSEAFHYGREVVIETEFGKDIAVISSFLFDSDEKSDSYSSGKMIRYSTDSDKDLRLKNNERAKILKATVYESIERCNLKMSITHVLVPLIGNKVVVYYVAKGRVDFRELLKDLRPKIKESIVMRQISPKQREDSFAIDHREPVSHYKR